MHIDWLMLRLTSILIDRNLDWLHVIQMITHLRLQGKGGLQYSLTKQNVANIEVSLFVLFNFPDASYIQEVNFSCYQF